METQKLVASDAVEFGDFGWDVKIKGNVIFASAIGTGTAYFFAQSSGAWSERTELMPSDENGGGASYGWTLDFDGRNALVTAPFSVIDGITQGVNYSYTRRR